MPERRRHNRYVHPSTTSIIRLFVKMISTSNIKKNYRRYQPIGSVVDIPKYPAVKKRRAVSLRHVSFLLLQNSYTDYFRGNSKSSLKQNRI